METHLRIGKNIRCKRQDGTFFLLWYRNNPAKLKYNDIAWYDGTIPWLDRRLQPRRAVPLWFEERTCKEKELQVDKRTRCRILIVEGKAHKTAGCVASRSEKAFYSAHGSVGIWLTIKYSIPWTLHSVQPNQTKQLYKRLSIVREGRDHNKWKEVMSQNIGIESHWSKRMMINVREIAICIAVLPLPLCLPSW